ncbi:MAG: DUF2851 family protein [Bacteroidales bacterium]|nr:DUF2851 family protein [Bacteroidales bacterium]
MKEEFLHYLWKYSLYDKDSLVDNENNKIIVMNPGEYNRDSGPDFFNARINIAGTVWAGNVEIHSRASNFNSHGHNHDHAFDNVILHVVGENDKRIFNARGNELLTVEIKFDPSLYDRYVALINNPAVIACQDYSGMIDRFVVRHWLHYLLIERLQQKSSAIMKIFTETGNDWDETFYRVLTRYFGFRVNTDPFEMLATTLPFKIIRKHADNRLQIESLLFGTAGMLEEGLFRDALADEYYRSLIREFRILSGKYSITPIHGWLWKFSRLRPVNFPTVRISQLAAMLSVAGGLFSRILESDNICQMRRLFEVDSSSYWNEHYIFGRKSKPIPKATGLQAAELLLVNAVIPLLFVYGQYSGKNETCVKALDFLDGLRPESNTVIDDWSKSGIEAESAFESQALIHLRDEYCRKRRCLECRIGLTIISSGKDLKKEEELILEP